MDKPDPRRITSASLEAIVLGQPEKAKLAEVLVRSLRGMSPQIAREIVFRETGAIATRAVEIDTDQLRGLASTIRGLYEPLLTSQWEPHIYEHDGDVIAFSAVPLRHLKAENKPVPQSSMSKAAELAMNEPTADTPQTHAQRRAQLTGIIDAELTKVRTRLASLEQQFAKAEDVEELRTAGEMIYGYLWQIEPGQAVLEVDGLRIPLDPALSAKENAQEYFDKYRRSQRAGEHLPARIEQAQHEIDYLRQLRVQVEQAESFAALESLRAELYELGSAAGEQDRKSKRQSKPKSDTGKRGPLLVDGEGNAIYVGRSGKENDHVTFTVAGPNDTWLHARGVPGSHVIVKWRLPQDDDPAEVIERAAALAGWYSSARESGSVEIDVAKRRHVRKIKGGGPGMVTYRNEHTILVKPRDESGL
jgi:predicted ribosome quality control (RQC) complex YloA/Tae2 family protein